MYKKISFIVLFVVLGFSFLITCKNDDSTNTEINDLNHPRILLSEGEEEQIKNLIDNDATWAKMHQAILDECNKIVALPLLERKMTGRRLLSVSRELLRRVFYLSYAYRMTGEDQYLQKAESEMLAAANFSDWNPSHFLDVAEMTMGMAIGYDWLFDELGEDSKNTIREAMVKKGIEPSFDSDYNWFLTATHNWNQVCNAGMVYGVLAIQEDYPELADEVINRALETIHLPMEDYEPDGAYPEGYGYWNYGTSFNVLLTSALDKVDPGLFDYSKHPGYLKTGTFLQSMVTPTGSSYNWGDAGGGASLSPAMFWFAQKNNDPSLLWIEKQHLNRDDYSRFTRNRILPAVMIWGKDIPMDNIVEPQETQYVGQGKMPLMLARTSWSDPNALYLGFKGGSPSVNHGHMDIGSFIMEADGVRWALDMGSQNYESLESRGMSIFGRTQDAERWTILRLNNYIHNTLTVNGELQRVKGYAKIEKHGDNPDFMFAVTEMISVYENQLAQALRGAAIVDGQYIVVRDELKAGSQKANVQWQMLTGADVEITGGNSAILKKDGKQLILKVDEPAGISLTTWSSQPVTDYDAPNPGTVLVGFETELNPDEQQNLMIKLLPASADVEAEFSRNLEDW